MGTIRVFSIWWFIFIFFINWKVLCLINRSHDFLLFFFLIFLMERPYYTLKFIFPWSISSGTQLGTQWGKHMYLLMSQGAQNYEAYNLLHLLLEVQTFFYRKTYLFQPWLPCQWNTVEDVALPQNLRRISLYKEILIMLL